MQVIRNMLVAAGCASMLAVPAFVFGFVGALLSNDRNMPALAVGTMFAAMTFFAALLLFARDHSQQHTNLKQVQHRLLARGDVSIEKFCAHFPGRDPGLIVDMRDAIGLFFNVASTKIHAGDELRRDYQFEQLEPGFHSTVVQYVLGRRNVPENILFRFETSSLVNLDDLAAAIEKTLATLLETKVTLESERRTNG